MWFWLDLLSSFPYSMAIEASFSNDGLEPGSLESA